MEELARALVPAKLRIVRVAHGVIPDEIWDLERETPTPAAALLEASASHADPRRNSLEGYVGEALRNRRSAFSTPIGCWRLSNRFARAA